MNFPRTLDRFKTAAVATGVLLVSACGGSTEMEPTQVETEALPAAPRELSLPVSFNEVMVGPIDHAAHELWNVALDEYAPVNDDQWTEVEHHATQIVALAETIMIPGTGAGDALWVQGDEWGRYAAEMSESGLAALDAARDHDRDGVLAAGDAMLEACLGCHMVYKPDVPSEGEFHPHYRSGAE